MRHRVLSGCICTLVFGLITSAAQAVPTTFGPIPYLRTADTPLDFYSQICSDPLHIEDFEPDATGGFTLDSFLTLGPGQRIGPDFMSGSADVTVDSVDDDDALGVDGDGSGGWAWYNGPSRMVTITFDDPVTSAGFVLTDGDSSANNVIVEVFDGSMASVHTMTEPNFLDASYGGQTGEDRFIGFRDANGIKSLKISIDAGLGIEIDHIQWQNCPVPEPSSMCLGLLGLASLFGLRQRRR